jgi:hypothetical protein
MSFILSWYRLVWGIKRLKDGAGESVKGDYRIGMDDYLQCTGFKQLVTDPELEPVQDPSIGERTGL